MIAVHRGGEYGIQTFVNRDAFTRRLAAMGYRVLSRHAGGLRVSDGDCGYTLLAS